MDTVASAVFPVAGAASRQVCLAFRLTPGPVPCQTRPAIVCVIRRRSRDAAAETAHSFAGWIGVPLTAFALYGGLALLLEDSASQTVLPLGRRGRARTSLEGDFGHQIEHAEREPGVRRQL